ncbi:MAG: Gfo/Idh/MocA family oxidoreductase [Bacteroidota bacterium]
MKSSRRQFLTSLSMLAASTAMPLSAFSFGKPEKLKVVLVGTGIRGYLFWGRRLTTYYTEITEFVGLCDINPGRMEYVKKELGLSCPTFSDFEQMIKETGPDLVIVTTRDSNHHEFIIKGLDMGCDVITEKPLTIDEHKAQAVIDAERRSGKNLIIGFNARWLPYNTKIKELLMQNTIGEIRSVDHNYYLNTDHGASYFRRWHGLRQHSGTLLVHKSTHHLDRINWWIDSDPEEVYAYGALEHYGPAGPFRGDNCRSCPHKDECKFFWDITKDDLSMRLYVDHEEHDGYIRDNCLFREEINIYDKMSLQVKYKNGAVLNYSLIAYSPYEGWRVTINGTKGRIEAWMDIPLIDDLIENQEGMDEDDLRSDSLTVHKLWEDDYETISVPRKTGGHGGADPMMTDKIFKNPEVRDPFDRAAGVRDGAMSMLIGVAARKSIESGKLIKIAELTDLEPRAKRILT